MQREIGKDVRLELSRSDKLDRERLAEIALMLARKYDDLMADFRILAKAHDSARASFCEVDSENKRLRTERDVLRNRIATNDYWAAKRVTG